MHGLQWYSFLLTETLKYSVLRQSQRKPRSYRDPHRKVASCSPLWSHEKHNVRHRCTFPPANPDSSHVVADGIPGCSSSAGVQQLGEVMGIPASWAQSEALKRLKPQLSRPQGLNQSGLHGGKITQISLQRTQKHLLNSSVWLSSVVSRAFMKDSVTKWKLMNHLCILVHWYFLCATTITLKSVQFRSLLYKAAWKHQTETLWGNGRH